MWLKILQPGGKVEVLDKPGGGVWQTCAVDPVTGKSDAGTCEIKTIAGAPVHLRAVPSANSTFNGWQKQGLACAGPTCSFHAPPTNSTVQANFKFNGTYETFTIRYFDTAGVHRDFLLKPALNLSCPDKDKFAYGVEHLKKTCSFLAPVGSHVVIVADGKHLNGDDFALTDKAWVANFCDKVQPLGTKQMCHVTVAAGGQAILQE